MMGKQGLGRLWRWVRARPGAHAALDAADVGTAFGMELFIEAEQRRPGKAPVAKPAETTPAATRPGR
jgi:hypothetical protein